jgi:hypothetical protein
MIAWNRLTPSASLEIAGTLTASWAVSLAVSLAGCAEPTGRPTGQAWQPEHSEGSSDDGAGIPDDDDGEWPEPTGGRLPDDDDAPADTFTTADTGDPGPGDTDGEPEETTGVPDQPGVPGPSPYAGGWDIGACQDDIVAGGDIAPDFTLADQNGDMVRLYDFCHKAVLLIEGAFW